MKVFIGSDHNGFELKNKLTEYLIEQGHEVTDMGDDEYHEADDFPLYAAKVSTAILTEENSVGILLCGSGQGVCMAANRFKGVRASLVWDEDEASSSRNDDDANVLCLPARKLSTDQAYNLVSTWLNTPFAGAARFKRRIKQLDELN